jgi:hypothetical protein
MDSENRATPFDEEIAEIENRRGTRNLFLFVGGILGLILLFVVVVGVRERIRLAREAARPQTEDVALGTYVGLAGNQALFAVNDELSYVEGIGQADVGDQTSFVRRLRYDELGNADTLPPGISHWSLRESDSLPYVVEPIEDPLIGVTPDRYRVVRIGNLSRGDYGSEGPNDWEPLEQDEDRVRVTGRIEGMDSSVYLVDEPSRVRLQGIEGLSPIDSLEMVWATGAGGTLTAYGRITSTPSPRANDPALFILTVSAVHPPMEEAPAP